jgi:prolipoprotein diacylglyceryltransferase
MSALTQKQLDDLLPYLVIGMLIGARLIYVCLSTHASGAILMCNEASIRNGGHPKKTSTTRTCLSVY